MLTIRKYDKRCDPEEFGGKYIMCFDRKDHGYVMCLTMKTIGQLIAWLFNRNAIRPFGTYYKIKR